MRACACLCVRAHGCACAYVCVRVHGCAYVHMRMRVRAREEGAVRGRGRCCGTKGRQAGKGEALAPGPRGAMSFRKPSAAWFLLHIPRAVAAI